MASELPGSELPEDPRLDREFAAAASGQPDPEKLAKLEQRLNASLKPVRPLPSDAVLVLLCILAFTALAVAGTVPVGFFGLFALAPYQMGVLYSLVIVSAVLLALALVSQMIPASRQRVWPALALLFPLVMLVIAVPMIFPDLGTAHFFDQGMPCLLLGTSAAVPGALFTWLFVSRGWVTNPFETALLAGGFSGLVGVGVLSLHCPILNSVHVLTWHLAVLVVAVAGGALAGLWMSRRRL